MANIPDRSGRTVNGYARQLTAAEIAAGRHRDVVGGLWDEVGPLQLQWMRSRGLAPHHSLVDIGCGALRGGLHLIRYLEPHRYCGLDINASLIQAGRIEIEGAGLACQQPRLLVDDAFAVDRFGVKFDYALAVSLFTHLHANLIVRCLVELRRALSPEGEFYATFFEAPAAAHSAPIVQAPDVTTHCDVDPFHYSVAELQQLAQWSGWTAEYLGDWQHPRNQKMACLRPR